MSGNRCNNVMATRCQGRNGPGKIHCQRHRHRLRLTGERKNNVSGEPHHTPGLMAVSGIRPRNLATIIDSRWYIPVRKINFHQNNIFCSTVAMYVRGPKV